MVPFYLPIIPAERAGVWFCDTTVADGASQNVMSAPFLRVVFDPLSFALCTSRFASSGFEVARMTLLYTRIILVSERVESPVPFYIIGSVFPRFSLVAFLATAGHPFVEFGNLACHSADIADAHSFVSFSRKGYDRLNHPARLDQQVLGDPDSLPHRRAAHYSHRDCRA